MNPATDSSELPTVIAVALDYLEQFKERLKVNTGTIQTTIGDVTPPLGFKRLKIIDFFLSLIKTNYSAVDQKFLDLDVFTTFLDLFFSYPFNNFLHTLVEQIIQAILLSDNEDLKLSFFNQTKLADRIVDGFNENERECAKPKGVRRGYMGHLINLSLLIERLTSTSDALKQSLEANRAWIEYVNGPLEYIRNSLSGNNLQSLQEPTDFPEEPAHAELGKFLNYQYLVSGEFASDFPDEFANEDPPYEENDLRFDPEKPFDGNFNTDEKRFCPDFDDDEGESSEDDTDDSEGEESEEEETHETNQVQPRTIEVAS